MNWLPWLVDALKTVPPVVASITLFTLLRAWWRRTLGRRRGWTRSYDRLVPGIHPDLVKELFGHPTFEGRATGRAPSEEAWAEADLTVRTWVLDRDGYLVTWTTHGDAGDAVVAYSLTTANRWFSPRIRVVTPEDRWVKLGRTVFDGALDDEVPEHLDRSGWLGARRSSYWERYYWGNPGLYLTWYIGYTNCGYSRRSGIPVDTSEPDATEGWIQEFRRTTSINSILVTHGSPEIDFQDIGPNLDLVRLASRPTTAERLRHWSLRSLLRRPSRAA
ncbi:ETEC_3214 domain-containing protein [Micromonospora sp. WMMD730]|uniref:ETEC_3214 domain-containing protein n=1 Tax=Micromonospora sp. WMMD730 TaxID=3404128 RepID=UPI003B932905